MCKRVQLTCRPDTLEAGRIEGLRSVALREIGVLIESKSADHRDRCRGSHSGFLQAQAGDELEESQLRNGQEVPAGAGVGAKREDGGSRRFRGRACGTAVANRRDGDSRSLYSAKARVHTTRPKLPEDADSGEQDRRSRGVAPDQSRKQGDLYSRRAFRLALSLLHHVLWVLPGRLSGGLLARLSAGREESAHRD